LLAEMVANCTDQARMTEETYMSNQANFFAIIDLVWHSATARQVLPETGFVGGSLGALVTMKG